MAYQAPVPVPLPTYNWATSNQMREFCLFKCQLETWTRICKIKAEEKLDYPLCILGKEGYATMDRWVPADETHKNDPAKFLDYIDSTLDDEISPWVCVYELEDITKQSDETIDELVNRICKLAWRAQISNGSDAAIEFKVQCRLIRAIPDADIELANNSWRSAMTRGYHTCLRSAEPTMLWSLEWLQCVPDMWYMPYTMPVRHMICWLPTHHAPTAPINTLLVDTTALPMTWHAKVVRRRVAEEQNAKAATPLTHKHPINHPISKNREKGREPQAAKAKTEKKPPHKDLFVAAMNCGMVGDMHPKEMIIDNISSQQCSEAYTVIKLPASASSKGTASVCVKIDTGSGGNILPLCLFQQLHPKQTSPDGLPIGLDPAWTKLTAYNGSPIPLYGVLHGPIFWQPSTPGAQPHMIHSYWYITDTPGPALLGLLACEKLAVVQVNCAVKTTQPDRSLTSTTPTQAARATKLPAMRTSKSKCIKSTDDLTREFPDWFTGIGKFPGKYKIWLCPDAHLVIHTPRKCPITLQPKVKEYLAKMEALGVITHVDQPTDWVSSITCIQKANGELHLCLNLHDLNRAIHHDHHKMPTIEEVAHEFTNFHYFTKLMHTMDIGP